MLWMLWEFQSRNGIPIRWLSKDELYGADDGTKDEFDIVLDNDMRKELNIMCNLSEGIAEEAREEGFRDGEDTATVRHLKHIMHKMHITLDEAMDMLEIPEMDRSQYASLARS